VDNLLSPKTDLPHCSKPGSNLDLVLECVEYFCLESFYIQGGIGCTQPIKFGLIWIHEEKPNIESYSSYFNDLTPEKYQTLYNQVSPQVEGESLPSNLPKPDMAFLTSQDTCEFQGKFTNSKKGKFVHLKFLSSYHRNADEEFVSFDIQKIHLRGYKADYNLNSPFPFGAIYTLVNNYFSSCLTVRENEFDFKGDISKVLEIASNQLNGDEESLPEQLQELKLKSTDIDNIIENMSKIDTDPHANVFERLKNILPILHTFRLFSGYHPKDLLLKPM